MEDQLSSKMAFNTMPEWVINLLNNPKFPIILGLNPEATTTRRNFVNTHCKRFPLQLLVNVIDVAYIKGYLVQAQEMAGHETLFRPKCEAIATALQEYLAALSESSIAADLKKRLDAFNCNVLAKDKEEISLEMECEATRVRYLAAIYAVREAYYNLAHYEPTCADVVKFFDMH